MKANTPEKIYLSQERDKDGCYIDLMWHKHPYEDMENIQYVRTDAFIEKACRWFRDIDYDDSIPPFETTEEFIEGFKKAMKL